MQNCEILFKIAAINTRKITFVPAQRYKSGSINFFIPKSVNRPIKFDHATVRNGFGILSNPIFLIKILKLIINALKNAQEIITGSSGAKATVSSFDSGTNILTLVPTSGTFVVGNTVTGGTTSTTGTIRRFDQATATATADVVTTTDGAYINQDGHISETTMKIQDSLLYQDYSYIIKVGRSINDWRDTYSTTLHISGFYFQGEINIETSLDAQIKRITGLNSGTEAILKSVITRGVSE